MPNAIIVGCATGMGKASAIRLAEKGYRLGLADCQFDLLSAFSKELSADVLTCKIDVAHPEEARDQLRVLIERMGGVDLFIFCAGVRHDKSQTWEGENEVYRINAIGFAALTHLVFNYFRNNRKKGHIVGITSILAMRGFDFATPYCASKFFMRGYLQGLRHQSAIQKLGISITEIRPGFVRTPMTNNQQRLFWVSSVEKAAAQIVKAIDQKKKWVYVTKRWELLGLLFKFTPTVIINLFKV
jgi:short-subunit dehydrogenase